MNDSESVVNQPHHATERVWLWNHKSNGLKLGGSCVPPTHITRKCMLLQEFLASPPRREPDIYPRNARSSHAQACNLLIQHAKTDNDGYVKLVRSLQDASACPTFALSPPSLPIVRQRVSGSSQRAS